METVNTVTNLILRSIIVIVVSTGFLLMMYAIFIKGQKVEFAIASLVGTALLTVFAGLAIKLKGSVDPPLPNVNTDVVDSAIDKKPVS